MEESREQRIPPDELTDETVIFWSEHYKRLEGLPGENKIRAKARLFLKHKCIEYFKDPIDKRNNCYICLPIHKYLCYECQDKKRFPYYIVHYPITVCPLCGSTNIIRKGYNQTTYHLPFKGTRFECSCQYFQTKLLKNEEPYCSHWLALYLYLKKENWNKRHIKKSMPVSAEVI
jgi:hypothetical protein